MLRKGREEGGKQNGPPSLPAAPTKRLPSPIVPLCDAISPSRIRRKAWKKAPVERRKGLSKKEFGRGGGGKPPELGDFFVFIRGPLIPLGKYQNPNGGGDKLSTLGGSSCG